MSYSTAGSCAKTSRFSACLDSRSLARTGVPSEITAFREDGSPSWEARAMNSRKRMMGLMRHGLAILLVGLSCVWCRGGQQTPAFADSLKSLRERADQGDAQAQNDLGFMYYAGQGVAQDYAEAFRWFRKAAEQGDAIGQHNLGKMYREGQGVTQDYAEALRWYRKAGEQGQAEA